MYRQWVKGKQVEDLRDLVTVSREHWIMRMPEGHGSHWFLETGKAILCVGSCEPGNLPVVGTGEFQITRTWSYRYSADPYSGSQKAEFFVTIRRQGRFCHECVRLLQVFQNR